MKNKKNHFVQLVLKKGMRDVDADSIQNRALRFLGIETGKIKSSKIFQIQYDLTEAQVQEFGQKALCDELLHDVFVNRLHNGSEKSYLCVSKLPGVTDDEGISSQKTLADLFNIKLETSTQHIFTQDLYLFEKDLSDEVLRKLGHELVGNPLINHFEYGKYKGQIKYIPQVEMESSDVVETINIFVSDDELVRLSKEKVLSLTLEEMKAIQNYYKSSEVQKMRTEQGLPLIPTDGELEILAQTWSEHCKHKEFSALINYKDLETGETRVIDSLFKTYIRGSTETIKERLEKAGDNWLVKIFTDNAGVVKINDDLGFVWKVETHNSPSAIDPYGGAITGILGNNRDAFGTGRGGGKPLFNTNVLCFGPPNYEKPLLTGQLHPRRIIEGVRHGIEAGGNKSGIPTVNGSLVFDDRFSGKPLVFCGTGAVMKLKYGALDSWVKEVSSGDLIVMAGGRVGKDGIHGATFSSLEINEHSPSSAVQIGSPITQKLVSDFLDKACALGFVKCTTDNGAGGLSSSIGELATLSGGAEVQLDKVPLKYAGLKPWEIFLSESQERMSLVVEESKIQKLYELASTYEVELSTIGKFTSSGLLSVKYNEKTVALLELDFLHDGVPRKYLNAEWKKPVVIEKSFEGSELKKMTTNEWNALLVKLLAQFNICSREKVIRQYDHEVKGKSIIKPLMGKSGQAPQDAAVVRFNFDSWEGVAISNGILPRYGDIDAYEMSAGAFDEAVRQIISIGGRLPNPEKKDGIFWSVNDNFCVPDSVYDVSTNPDGKYKLAQLVRMCDALRDMALEFNIPMTSGKDSMKNDFKADGKKISVPPTVLYSMAAKITDVRKVVTSDFKKTDDIIYILGTTYDELGESEFYKMQNYTSAKIPKVRRSEAKELYLKVMKANEQNLIESCHDISDGGLAVTLSECCFGNDFGLAVDLENIVVKNEVAPLVALFSESHSRFVVTVRPNRVNEFEAVMTDSALYLGKVTGDGIFHIENDKATLINIQVNQLLSSWNKGIL